MSLEQQAATVVPYADQLSLPFCQLVLHQIFSTSALSTDHVVESVSAAFLSTIKTAIEKEQPCWSNLISGLEPDLLNKVRRFHRNHYYLLTLLDPRTCRTSSH
jgi:mediator of RNA polymerase II transcription subunit 12